MKNSIDTARFPVDDEDFRKSSWSKNNPKTCVMVAIKPEGIAIRDSKDSSKSTLFFNHEEWSAFLKGVNNGEFETVL
jgi:hypothetical protein